MKGLFRRLKEYWALLHQDIYVGDMRTQNMKACLFVGVAVAIASGITTTLNIIGHRDLITTLTTISQVIGGIIIVVFILKDNKKIPTLSMLIICIITFTYYGFSGATGGTTVIWTILTPLGIGYFGNAIYGIYCGVYFEIMLIALFYTPIRHQLEGLYSELFMDRFPVLYFLNLALVSICLINYHMSVLKLMDYGKQMREAKEEADRANRGKSDFLSNMSHEIRTPINAVLGMNEMILRESIKANNYLPEDKEDISQIFSDISKYSGNIERAGNNLLYIINDILDFSKIESGKMNIVAADYTLSSILNDVSNMIFFKAKDKGLKFEVDVDRNIPDHLHGDEVRIRQIITNILGNAVKYTKQGSVRMTVRAEEIKDKNQQSILLKIDVTDTGIGIKEEDIAKLFTKFERVDLEQNSTVEGTGLGLAITRNLLEMMGGHIEVKSVYNEGSTFTIYLPQPVISDEPLGDFRKKFDESIQEMEVYVESFHAPDARILIVDDTKMNLIVVEGLLKNTGLKIDTASSGFEGIALARDNQYDIILMDQRMPGMGGTEAMQHIKDEKGINCNTPFICLTADAISGAKERYMSAGFIDYLTKPIDYKALEKMLIRYLPKEKVDTENKTAVSNVNLNESNPNDKDEFDRLSDMGFAVKSGMRYSNHDKEFYRSLLQDFVIGFTEKYNTIQKYYDIKDWRNYEIYVHSLKSSSKTIGANKLSEIAEQLEGAAGEKKIEIIQHKHEMMMRLYKETTDIISKVFTDFKAQPDDAEDILEFEPI